jgi:hypothetical protein
VVGEARVIGRWKNAGRGKMGNNGHAWVENPPCRSDRTKIPPLRGGSLTLWSHRRVGVRGTPGSQPGGTAGAVGGPKAANSGWQIVQNKANLPAWFNVA